MIMILVLLMTILTYGCVSENTAENNTSLSEPLQIAEGFLKIGKRGKKLVFNSDRDGTDLRQITFNKNEEFRPSWGINNV